MNERMIYLGELPAGGAGRDAGDDLACRKHIQHGHAARDRCAQRTIFLIMFSMLGGILRGLSAHACRGDGIDGRDHGRDESVFNGRILISY